MTAALDKAMPQQNVVLRDMIEEDRAFIFATWLNSYANARTNWSITRSLYFFEHKRVVERLLAENAVIVAADALEPKKWIYGWIVGIPSGMMPTGPGAAAPFAVVHYVFVKGDFREFGIGAMLVDALCSDAPTIFYSHLPPVDTPAREKGAKSLDASTTILKLTPPGVKAIYNPYLAYQR